MFCKEDDAHARQVLHSSQRGAISSQKKRHAVAVFRPNATFRPHVRRWPLRFDLRCLLLFPCPRDTSKCSRTTSLHLSICGGRLPRADSRYRRQRRISSVITFALHGYILIPNKKVAQALYRIYLTRDFYNRINVLSELFFELRKC